MNTFNVHIDSPGLCIYTRITIRTIVARASVAIYNTHPVYVAVTVLKYKQQMRNE